MNVNNPDDRQEYLENYFTEDGKETLINYTESLVKVFRTSEPTDYPQSFGPVFGIPMFDWSQQVDSQDEMRGRIKVLMQILGLSKLELDNGRYVFELTTDGS